MLATSELSDVFSLPEHFSLFTATIYFPSPLGFIFHHFSSPLTLLINSFFLFLSFMDLWSGTEASNIYT